MLTNRETFWQRYVRANRDCLWMRPYLLPLAVGMTIIGLAGLFGVFHLDDFLLSLM